MIKAINSLHIFKHVGEIIEFTEYFKREFDLLEKDRNKVRSELDILICGAYYPGFELKRLLNIQKRLKDNGWKKAKLVKDYTHFRRGRKRGVPSFRERSFHAMEKSDIIIFIFTKGGQSDGRGMEVEHVFSTPYLLWKTIFIFEEEPNGIMYGSDLILGELKTLKEQAKVAASPVGDDEAMFETIESQLVNFLEGLPRFVPKDTTV